MLSGFYFPKKSKALVLALLDFGCEFFDGVEDVLFWVVANKLGVSEVLVGAGEVLFGVTGMLFCFGEMLFILKKCCFGSFNPVFTSKCSPEGWWNVGWKDRNVGWNGKMFLFLEKCCRASLERRFILEKCCLVLEK